MKKSILLSVALVATFFMHAQQHTDAYLRAHPVWIDAMKDPQVNYHAAVKAFELFWEGRELPVGEHELMNAAESEAETGALIRQKKNQPDATSTYAFAYRQFKRWMIKNEPFVKADGTLYSAEERVQLWKQQQENRK